jgi:eukaryotic-like serine/threonine-protein kinase
MDGGATQISPGATLAGKLRVIRMIGSGGMGAVYEVEHELTKHRRALKLLHAEMARIPGVVTRFLREASAAGRIGSRHIVETFDAGQLETGEPYIVMEMLKGRPLDALIEKMGRLDYAQAIEILKQACDGVQAAHDAGIVHRDLKPENMFLVESTRIFVKILDFGISKFDPSRTEGMNLTQEGTALGTPFYMSPEQVRGEANLDVRTDVYALGVVLYECLTGKKPFDADSLPHLAVLIHEGKYAPLKSHRPDAPVGLEAVIARAMAVDRNHRYPTARALKQSLEEIDVAAKLAAGATLLAPATAIDGTPKLVIDDSEPEPRSRADAVSGVSEASRSKRRGAFFAVLAATIAALCAVAAVWSSRREGRRETIETPVEVATSVPSASAEPPAPEVVPALAPLDPPHPEGEPEEPAVRRAGPARPAPRPAQQRMPSRATRHGLVQRNPF